MASRHSNHHTPSLGSRTSRSTGSRPWERKLGAVSKPALPPTLPTQKRLKAITDKQLTAASPAIKLGVENCEYVASYNWLEKSEAAILIPGECSHHTKLPYGRDSWHDANLP